MKVLVAHADSRRMAAQGLDDKLFGSAAVELRLLTSTQLGECYVLQRDQPLAQVCAEHGYLTRDQVEQVLRYQRELQRRLQGEAHLFGRVAMSLKLLTMEQLRDCLVRQQSSGFKQRLGEITIERGLLTPEQVAQILQRQKAVSASFEAEIPRFGKFALEMGLLTQDQLEECVRLQQEEGAVRRLGEICVAKSYMTSADVKAVLERQTAAKRDTDAQPGGHATVTGAPSDASNPPALDGYLRFMVNKGASDLHLSTNSLPCIRVDGQMVRFGRDPLGAADMRELLMAVVDPKTLKQFEDTRDADFAYAIEGFARFRANYFIDRNGLGAVFRHIPQTVLTAQQIGLPSKITELCWLQKGLVLVTGPTGSGKSTTLAAMIDFINEHRSDHIITIEDPIEFVHKNKACLVNQREVGSHTQSFQQALRAALREDPDVILVGELRDLETVAIAIETAETGHLVFGTLHTTSAATTIDRIVDQFPAGQQSQIRTMLAASLRGVVAQMLCKKKGGGRTPAFEFLLSTPAVANIIRESKTEQLTNVMQTGRRLGMQTMNDHLFGLVQQGIVEPKDAYLASNDKRGLKQRFSEARIPLPA